MNTPSTTADSEVTDLTPVSFPDGRVVYAPPDDPIQSLPFPEAIAANPREAALFLFGAVAGLTAGIFLRSDVRRR